MNTAKKVLGLKKSEQDVYLLDKSTHVEIDFNDQDMTFTFRDGSVIRLEDGELFELAKAPNSIDAIAIAPFFVMIAVELACLYGVSWLASLAFISGIIPLMIVLVVAVVGIIALIINQASEIGGLIKLESAMQSWGKVCIK